jgi:hypothetical protein
VRTVVLAVRTVVLAVRTVVLATIPTVPMVVAVPEDPAEILRAV